MSRWNEDVWIDIFRCVSGKSDSRPRCRDHCIWQLCLENLQALDPNLHDQTLQQNSILYSCALYMCYTYWAHEKNTLPPFLAASSSVLRETCKEDCCNFTIGTLLERQFHFSNHIWDTAHTQSYSKSNWSKEVIFVAVHGRYRFFKITPCRITRIIWITWTHWQSEANKRSKRTDKQTLGNTCIK